MTRTYDRRVQLGASRHRLKDALVLHDSQRWTGAIYLAGYAIECSLKALICYEAGENNFKDTKAFKEIRGSDLHSLVKLLEYSTSLKRAISTDRTGIYRTAWNTISGKWRNDELRYSDNNGDKQDCIDVIKAVYSLHQFILDKQHTS